MDEYLNKQLNKDSGLIRKIEKLEAALKNQLEENNYLKVENLKLKSELDVEKNRFNSFFINAPVAIKFLRGENLIFEFVNPSYQEIFPNRDLIGKSLREAIPEVESQGIYELHDNVYKTGIPFINHELKVSLDRFNNGNLKDYYYTLIYQPFFNADNQIEGLGTFAFDITQHVIARKELERVNEKLSESENEYKLLAESLELKIQKRTEELVKANKEIEYQRNKLDSLFISAPAFIALLTGKDHKFAFVNPNYKRLMGNRELVGKTIRDALPELVGQGYYELLDNVYNTAKNFIGKDVPALLDRNGDGNLEECYFNFNFQPIYDAENNIEGVSIFAFEVTEEVFAREKVENISKDLELSNKSLQDFASVASHDLKSPIRTMASYANILQRKYKDKLDEKANDYINFIINSSNRLNNLIDDLLEHSKLNTNHKNYTESNFNNLLDIVLSNLKPIIEENKVTIKYKDLPTLLVNQNQMISVFQNLIDNSIKYRNQSNPIIEISASEEDNNWVFLVSDNGLGFDNKYSDKIFEIFQRLHTDYEGTGIGLATVKKIIETHGGKIWVDSNEGIGSKFYFSLPKN